MTERVVWDPRKLIGPPWVECPKCKQESLGTSMISGRTIVRQCKLCLHRVSESLPEPRQRKVIYLDQFVFSNMAKTLDPVWSKEVANQAPIWSDLFDALDRAFKLQLIVVPESSLHERESIVHKHHDVLERLYGHFSAETSLEFPSRVHWGQLRVALHATFKGTSPDFRSIPQGDVVRGRLAEWPDRLRIRVNYGQHLHDPQDLREQRERSGKALAALFERWGREKPSFEQVLDAERTGLAYAMLQRFAEHIAHVRRVSTGEVPFDDAVWNYSLEIDTVHGLIREAEEAGLGVGEAVRFVHEFLYSEAALSCPMNEISAHMFAGLAWRASSGQKRPPSRGMWTDITAISAYLPYCDAMFVDNECAELLREEPTKSLVKGWAKVFSLRNVQEFMAYLRQLEVDAGQEWIDLIHRIYGPNWTAPFRSILQHERESAARRARRDAPRAGGS